MKRVIEFEVGDTVLVRHSVDTMGKILRVDKVRDHYEVELSSGHIQAFSSYDLRVPDPITCVGSLGRLPPVSVKIDGHLKGEHIHSRLFVGPQHGTRALAGAFTMKPLEWLAFTRTLKMGTRLSGGSVRVEVEHEPLRTDAGNPAHGCETCDGKRMCSCPHKKLWARCLTCGGRWPECAS